MTNDDPWKFYSIYHTELSKNIMHHFFYHFKVYFGRLSNATFSLSMSWKCNTDLNNGNLEKVMNPETNIELHFYFWIWLPTRCLFFFYLYLYSFLWVRFKLKLYSELQLRTNTSLKDHLRLIFIRSASAHHVSCVRFCSSTHNMFFVNYTIWCTSAVHNIFLLN